MGFSAKVLCDSLNPETEASPMGVFPKLPESRLTTMELTYPRCIHSEFMTHRAFSRNAASSRAIPVAKMLKDIREEPFIPVNWGKNQKGMQAGAELSNEMKHTCKLEWLAAWDCALHYAENLNSNGLHKQIVNRIVEPWMWITVIATGVDKAWENFFSLRCHKDAEPHMQEIAYMARDAYDGSVPLAMEWCVSHTPMVNDEDRLECLKRCNGDVSLASEMVHKISTGRCARVSYLTHDGRRDIGEDIALHDRLAASGHWSPFEHVATATTTTNLGGNFGPRWIQYRKTFTKECCERAPREQRGK